MKHCRMKAIGIVRVMRANLMLHCVIIFISLILTHVTSVAVHIVQYERSQAEFQPQAMTSVSGRYIPVHTGNGIFELKSPQRAMQYEYEHGIVPIPISPSIRWTEVRDEHDNTVSIQQVVKSSLGSQYGIAEPWSNPYVITNTMQYWTGDTHKSDVIDQKLSALGIRFEGADVVYPNLVSRFVDERIGWNTGSRFHVYDSNGNKLVKLSVSIESGWPFRALSLYRDDEWPVCQRQNSVSATRDMFPRSVVRSGIWIATSRKSHPAWHPYTGMPIPIWPIWPNYYIFILTIHACLYMVCKVVPMPLRHFRKKRNLCSVCGYNVIGLTSCPECGSAIGTACTH